MQISIQSDIKKATRALGRLSKQIPFAASVAMNKTATKIQQVERAAMKRELDNPRPATVKGIRVMRSNKRNLEAAVFVIPAIDRFLRYQVQGGTRRPDGRAISVPVNTRLNKYGNIPGRRSGKIAKLMNRPDTFSGTVKGVPGLYQRGKGRSRHHVVKLLIAWEPRATYRPRFRFYDHAVKTARRVWPRQFRQAIRHAVRTAR